MPQRYVVWNTIMEAEEYRKYMQNKKGKKVEEKEVEEKEVEEKEVEEKEVEIDYKTLDTKTLVKIYEQKTGKKVSRRFIGNKERLLKALSE